MRKLTAFVFACSVQAIASEALAEDQIDTPAFWLCPAYSESVLAIFEHQSGYIFYASPEAEQTAIRALGTGAFELHADVESGSYAYLKSEGENGWTLNTIKQGSVTSFSCTDLHNVAKQIVSISSRDIGGADLKMLELDAKLEKSSIELIQSSSEIERLESNVRQLEQNARNTRGVLAQLQKSKDNFNTASRKIAELEGQLQSVSTALVEATKKIEWDTVVQNMACAEQPELSNFFVPYSADKMTGEVAFCN